MIHICKEYLGFDDRRLMLIGIPFVSIVVPFVFFGRPVDDYLRYCGKSIPESLFFTLSFWLLFRELIIRMRKRMPHYRQVRKRIFLQFLIIFITAPIIKSILSWVVFEIYNLFGIEDFIQPGFIESLLSIYLPSMSMVFLYEAIYFFIKYKESIIEKERIETEHVQTQLDNLRNQINPHFLFNSLNTLMNLIQKDSAAAATYLSKLSKFYRYAVGNQDQKLISLNEELAMARLYSDLLSERFHEGIQVEIKINNNVNRRILPLCLQLLIENAVKHNVVSKSHPLNILISLNEESDFIIVKNNKQKKIEPVSSTGMGLKNIESRLAYFTNKKLFCLEDEHMFKVGVPLL